MRYILIILIIMLLLTSCSGYRGLYVYRFGAKYPAMAKQEHCKPVKHKRHKMVKSDFCQKPNKYKHK